MAGSDPSLSYSAPGHFDPPDMSDLPSARVIDPRSLIGNALWKGAKGALQGVWENVIKPPGQILEGSLVPSMEPGPNQLSIPEYGLNLFGTALGTRGLGFSAPEGALTHFPVYQGTPAKQVFREHSDDFLGTGAGTAYEGPGHYTAERQGIAESYKPGDEGGLLHINVIPEKNEYLDMNAPWKDQDPQVKERLEKAGFAPGNLDPMHYAYHEMNLEPPENMIGRDLYWSHVHKRAFELAGDATGSELPTAYDQDLHMDRAAMEVAQDMDKAGVPGRKFLDRPSRGIGPVLSHEGNFNGMPGSPWLDHIMREELPPGTFNADHAISQKARYLRNTTMLTDPGLIKTANDAADWLEKEHAAGRFSLDDNKRTRNFITTNPKNLQIRTWNGVPLEPVPHDPFTHSLTPVEGDPFGGQVP